MYGVRNAKHQILLGSIRKYDDQIVPFETFSDLFWKIPTLRRLFVTAEIAAESPSRKILYKTEIEGIVLLENRHNTLPLHVLVKRAAFPYVFT